MLILTITVVKWKWDEPISDRVTLDSSKSDMGYGQSIAEKNKFFASLRQFSVNVTTVVIFQWTLKNRSAHIDS